MFGDVVKAQSLAVSVHGGDQQRMPQAVQQDRSIPARTNHDGQHQEGRHGSHGPMVGPTIDAAQSKEHGGCFWPTVGSDNEKRRSGGR